MNILIIEDNTILCDELSHILTKHYEDIVCTCRYTYDDGLTTAQQYSFDILIVDYELEKNNREKNGIELCRNLQSIAQYRNIPVILETAFPQQLYQAVNSLNCIYFLEKPYYEKDIQNMMNQVFFRLDKEKKIIDTLSQIKLGFHDRVGITYQLPILEIVYIKASSYHHIYVKTCSNEFDFISTGFSKILEESKQYLIRCHRSYLINPRYLSNIDKTTGMVTLTCDTCQAAVPVGRKYKELLSRVLIQTLNIPF